MSESSSRIPIVVALIAATASVGAALIANWDKLFARPQVSVAAPVPVATPAPAPVTTTATEAAAPAPSPARTRVREPSDRPATLSEAPRPLPLTGTWRDVTYPGIVSSITQDGAQFRFTRGGVLPNGVAFQSNGGGAISGSRVALQYMARYDNGQVSQGQCEGTLADARESIELYCSDSQLGNFQSVSVRQ